MRVQFSVEMIERLGVDAFEAWKVVPHPGLEVGGILLGRLETCEGVTALSIGDYRVLRSEYRTGPSFHLSETDMRRLDELVAEHPDLNGIYRTHTRSERLELDDADAELFQLWCMPPHQLFVLIHPGSQTAAFFLSQNGVLVREHEFPFRADTMPIGPQQLGRGARRPEAVRQTVAARQPLPKARRKKAALTIITAALALGLALGTAALFRHRHRPPVVATRVVEPRIQQTANTTASLPLPGTSEVVLNIRREGQSLHLFWDLHAELVHRPVSSL